MNECNNPFLLNGKTILITGASSGIGEKTAIECSKLGAKIIATGRNTDRLNKTIMQLEGEGHKAIVADLTTDEGKQFVLDGIEQLNGVVLNAGQTIFAPLSLASRNKFDEIFEVNYFAPIELMRMVLKSRKLDNNSSVVFVCSIAGVKTITKGNTIYGASKSALNSTMKFFALELARQNIRCNAVLPGNVNTNMINGGGIFNEEYHKKRIQEYPLKRYGDPKDIAYGIIYLLSDASSWVTGHSLVIDGGASI